MLPFHQSTGKRADHPLELIHSGKIRTRSLEYFITFVDDHTRHVWVHILKHKSASILAIPRMESPGGEVEWKAIHSDNRGEYTSSVFTS